MKLVGTLLGSENMALLPSSRKWSVREKKRGHVRLLVEIVAIRT